jgi:hypothetical protein
LKKPQKDLEDDTQTSKAAKKTASNQSVWKKTTMVMKKYWKQGVMIVCIIGGIVGILYRIRGKWLPSKEAKELWENLIKKTIA